MQQQAEILKALATNQQPAAKEVPANSETGDEGGGELSGNPNAVKNRNRRRNQAARKRQQSAEQTEPLEDLEVAKRPRPAEDKRAVINLVSDDDEPQEFNGRPLDPTDLRWSLVKKAQE
eukprot:1648297-Pyramimonas_sp.AAC.1